MVIGGGRTSIIIDKGIIIGPCLTFQIEKVVVKSGFCHDDIVRIVSVFCVIMTLEKKWR
jgi:hypothetical protein